MNDERDLDRRGRESIEVLFLNLPPGTEENNDN
jgi:hypothetical protein